MRGKGALWPLARPTWRITPACAGKSFPKSLLMKLTWDHPRVCGEKRKHFIDVKRNQGSPPRVRGKEPFAKMSLKPGRITPACAGKSLRPVPTRRKPRDHPRVCGEKSSLFKIAALSTGSPPRVRGKVKEFACKDGSPRITPACAGKRRQAGHQAHDGQDHPRVCGEKYQKPIDMLQDTGSPPRVRGKD